MANGNTPPIEGTKGRVQITVGATTTIAYFTGKFSISRKVETTKRGPWIGNSNIFETQSGGTWEFSAEGDLAPSVAEVSSNTFYQAILTAHSTGTKPDTLTFETVGGGSSFAFAAANTTYTEFTYEHDGTKGPTFSTKGSGSPTITAGPAS